MEDAADGMVGGTCAMCGRTVDAHNRHVRFTWPDPVFAMGLGLRGDAIWMSHADARSSVMMQVPDLGAFIRALLPVTLTGGFTLTFGVWIGVHPDDLQRAHALWWTQGYPSLELEGRLANAVPPWGLLAAPVHAVVRDPEQTPYCDSSSHPELASVLSDEWAHETVLAAVDGI